ncbi:Rieske (2Fe-2S) protein [Kutzneria chonburiensis]|uniref:Rieske (2Fe-2S) protein n=1 Tax=Kutzneria chonburiensis TaxID=1483604 RepID=A0ABV6N0W8_9PSEU|nr:Rieske 2Fe-2S domain-containing protein [Kutzneria chonburiensis]
MKRDARRFVDDLLGQRRPRPFQADEEDEAVVRTAVELAAARPGADEPSPEFVSQLRDRVTGDSQPRAHTSRRRRVLQVAAAAAGAFTVGIVADRAVASGGDTTPVVAAPETEIMPTHGTWATVAASTDLVEGAVREFDLGAVVGVVQRTSGRLRAVSSVCTHMACRLGLNDKRDTLVCPCHGATFSVAGQPVRNLRSADPLPALPRLAVREFEGSIQIYCPVRG